MTFKFPDGIHWGGGHLRPRDSKFWTVMAAFALAVLLGSDVVWVVFREGTMLLLEFVAGRLELFFQRTFNLDLYHAQMATAYTGAAVLLISALVMWRKLVRVAALIRDGGSKWWHDHSARMAENLHEKAERLLYWWSGLDLLNKSAVLVALILMAVPAAVAISYGLGTLVAEIL